MRVTKKKIETEEKTVRWIKIRIVGVRKRRDVPVKKSTTRSSLKNDLNGREFMICCFLLFLSVKLNGLLLCDSFKKVVSDMCIVIYWGKAHLLWIWVVKLLINKWML